MLFCANCGKKWNLFNTYRVTMAHNGLNCLHCGQRQYLSTKSLKKLSIGWLTILVLPFIRFLVELSSQQEPMW